MIFQKKENCNTLTQRIIENQPQVTTVAGPQTISFQNIKRKRKKKTAAQAQIQRLSPLIDEVLNENEKNRKNR